MNKIRGDVRTSQLILTYGVGSLVALGKDSFIVAGLDSWDVNDDEELHEPRLERLLQVSRFYRPKATEEEYDVPIRRFPTWYQCPECNRIDASWKFGGSFLDPTCMDCVSEPTLIPSRFVIACARGHLDDFPFSRWAHEEQRHPSGDSGEQLWLKAGGLSAGLADITVQCSCGASRTMEGAFGRKALQPLGNCRGRRPWLTGEREPCTEFPRTLQRGASNVWFSVPRSAISIPPWSEGAFRILDRHWKVLKVVPDSALDGVIRSAISSTGEYDVADLVDAARQRKQEEGGSATELDLKEQEYEALRRGRKEVDREQQFVCVPATDAGALAYDVFDCVQQVRRLREVKALEGFTRLHPPSESPDELAERMGHISVAEMDWLPAIEVTGEGVFFDLSSDYLAAWERLEAVRQRAERIISNWKRLQNPRERSGDSVTPRHILTHTLSHVLIDQWALECGYPSASLTERMYVSENMAGFLIYTATTDSAGSLGGVISMTSNGRLEQSLRQALSRAAWCSSDPLCIEGSGRGVDALNLAACHACVLLPETSCELRNVLLDRAMLVGTLNDPGIGFFTELIRS